MKKIQMALKAEYFDAIRSGEKTEEYRLANPYWEKRLRVPLDAYASIILTKGYPRRGDPERTIERVWKGYTKKTITHPHFGDDPVEVFAIDVSLPSPPSHT